MLRKALQYQRLCGGVLALHEEDPSLSAGGAMHEGEVSALLGIAGIPSHQRVDDGRPRRRARRLRGRRASTSSTSARASRSRRSPPPRPRGVRISAEASPHHLMPHRRGACRGARHAHEDEPAAAHRGRPPGAHRRPARRARSTASPPTTRRTRATRRRCPFEQAPMGTTGLETAFAARPHRPRAARRPAAGARRRAADAPARALLDLPTPRIALGAPANLTLVDLDARVGRRRARLREPLGELLLRRPHAAAAGSC